MTTAQQSATYCLSPRWRAFALERLARERFDVVVIGGGITGAGVLLEAASRGLRAALVEKHDFAAGTSSKSSRLIHGGLRYLEKLDLFLVAESLRERNALLRAAPHLVWRAPFVIPFFQRSAFDRRRHLVRMGLFLYDAMARLPKGMCHSRIDRDELEALAPGFAHLAPDGALLYWDAVNDDARTCLAVLRTAAARGALPLNYCEATEAMEHAGGIELRLHDRISGQTLTVIARAVVNATGAWADETASRLGLGKPLPLVKARGAHLVLSRTACTGRTCVLLPDTDNQRFVFLVPSGTSAILGTTDIPQPEEAPPNLPMVNEVAYLASTFDRWASRPLEFEEIKGGYAGIRPLVAQGSRKHTKDISRRHVVRRSSPRSVLVTGGKFTTYQAMARATVDLLLEQVLGESRPSPRGRLHLVGACSFRHLAQAARAEIPAIAVSPLSARVLWRRHGLEALEVLRAHRRALEIGVVDSDQVDLRAEYGLEFVLGEAIVAFEREAALFPADFLSRRLRLLTDDPTLAKKLLPAIAKVREYCIDSKTPGITQELDRSSAGSEASREVSVHTTELPARLHAGFLEHKRTLASGANPGSLEKGPVG